MGAPPVGKRGGSSMPTTGGTLARGRRGRREVWASPDDGPFGGGGGRPEADGEFADLRRAELGSVRAGRERAGAYDLASDVDPSPSESDELLEPSSSSNSSKFMPLPFANFRCRRRRPEQKQQQHK
mmetsp:Transcript_127802/g.367942  ORF Transcript_127802/g.367942 Transcript_127802/m.367942 type:complete len:126 (-) Transcript_127802:327-704(-)